MTVNKRKEKILYRIKQDPNFQEIYEIAKRNANGKIYLVGGKLYRTAIEVLHECYVGADKTDWDFLCLKVDNYNSLPKNWRYKLISTSCDDGKYPEEYISNSKRLEKISGIGDPSKRVFGLKLDVECKVDLIDVSDAVALGGFTPDINGYMNAVPISTQAIAYDFENDKIIGDMGLWSIINRTCFLNPTFDTNEACFRTPGEWKDYFQDKTNELKFEWHSGKHKCYCSPESSVGLWWGCKCGGI